MLSSLNLEQSSAKDLITGSVAKAVQGRSAITAVECLFDPVNITS